MNWNNVSVFKYQLLFELEQQQLPDIEKTSKVISILYDIPEENILNLSIKKFNKISNELQFLNTNIVKEKKEYIEVNGTRYKCNYDVKNMEAGRYIETKYFGVDYVNNIHRIAASMIIPQSYSVLKGWQDIPYDSSKHEDYAQDMLDAPIDEVLSCVVFFCQELRNWIINSWDYLSKTYLKMNLTQSTINLLLQTLCETLDGFINVHLLPNMSELN